jgi:hypothetical protein
MQALMIKQITLGNLGVDASPNDQGASIKVNMWSKEVKTMRV